MPIPKFISVRMRILLIPVLTMLALVLGGLVGGWVCYTQVLAEHHVQVKDVVQMSLAVVQIRTPTPWSEPPPRSSGRPLPTPPSTTAT
jgi:hypothetical protein